MKSTQPKGTLYLIPTPLGENPPLEVLPLTIKKKIEELNHYIVENEKNARGFIKKITPQKKQDKLIFWLLNKFTTQLEMETYLNPLKEGVSMGLLSDAGCPAVADPGTTIIKRAHYFGIKVKPMVGPSSILLGLMASGLNGQNFAFNGYLPINKNQRVRALKLYERKSLKENQSQIFIETPYRNDKLFHDLINNLNPQTELCIACNLNLESSSIKTAPVIDWKKIKPNLHKKPAIFIINSF